MKTSIGKILKGFEHSITGPISIFKSKGYEGKGISRTMFLTPESLEAIPEELFALKISQSSNPALAGKAAFRYFGFKFTDEEKFQSVAPDGLNLSTPLADVKAKVIAGLSLVPEAQYSISVPLKGKFTPVKFADDTFNIYDEAAFPNESWEVLGEPPYYLKQDTIVTVKLSGHESRGNEYFRSELSTNATSDEALQKKGAVGKIWGADESGSVSGEAAIPAAAPSESPWG